MNKLSQELFTYEEMVYAMSLAFKEGVNWESYCASHQIYSAGNAEERHVKTMIDNIVRHLCEY